MEKADIIIIGAGVVGLAIAVAVSSQDKNVIIIEKEKYFGQGASSRNSEIIHAGIYYPKNSLKASLCVEGKQLLYQFCQEQNIPHKKKGKLIVATDAKEELQLQDILANARANGIEDLSLIDSKGLKLIEPKVSAIAAIKSPSTGIIDTHQFMKRLEHLSINRGAIFAYNCEVAGISKNNNGYTLDINDADGEKLKMSADIVINSAGLYSDKIADMAGIDIKKYGYQQHYCKGEYFRLKATKARGLNHLIYPVPEEAGLGIHTVEDMQGEVRLGPNAFYVDKVDYNVDPAHSKEFYESVKRYMPSIVPDDLTPDMAGVRAKLQPPGGQKRDFIISEEADKGFPGFINLIGIESPGLTASLAIAKYIGSML